MNAPLAGLRVLDLSRILAGPFATQQLIDLGADVIKVEPPRGDATRDWGPPFAPDGRSAYFITCNRGKRSIVIDLSRKAGHGLVQRMAANADILVENFRPGTMQRWGLDLDKLRDAHPRLITASISGFGAGGARAMEPGYDALVQAMSGLMAITGPSDANASHPGTEHPGTKVGVAVVDIVTGLFVSTGVLARLHGRDGATNPERHLEVCLHDSALSLLANVTSSVLMTGEDTPRHGNAHPSIVPYEVFAVADGSLFLAVGSDDQWRRLTEILVREDWRNEPLWQHNAGRVRDRDRLVPRLARELSGHSLRPLLERLEKAGIPAGPIRTVTAALADPSVVDRGQILEHCDGTRSVNTPLRFGDDPGGARSPAPHLGEHSEEILRELGVADPEIAEWLGPGGICRPSAEVSPGRG